MKDSDLYGGGGGIEVIEKSMSAYSLYSFTTGSERELLTYRFLAGYSLGLGTELLYTEAGANLASSAWFRNDSGSSPVYLITQYLTPNTAYTVGVMDAGGQLDAYGTLKRYVGV